MQTSLQAIANKAKKHKHYRFQNLYRLLDVAGLTDTWTGIKKQAAPGIDRITAMEFAKNLEGNIQRIVAELKEKRYKAKLVRRTYIPKGPGKMRPLGIPVVADKVVQRRAYEKTSFEFLGFEFRWGISHKGKDIIKRQRAGGNFESL